MKHSAATGSMILICIFSLSFYTCKKENSPGKNKTVTTTIFLTDHPTPVFDSVFIDIQKLEVKMEDSMSNDSWFPLTIQAGVYNILKFRNGIDTLFANGSVPGHSIRKLRLTLGSNNSVMKNGLSFPLEIKNDEKEVVANLSDDNFDILSPGQVLFWIDFDAGNSIRVNNSGQGNNNGYVLKPHIKIFTKTKSGRIEGKVLPLAADPIILAINGTDTATAIPDDHGGEFKIFGLNAGTYKLFIDGQNGYLDTTISNIHVVNGQQVDVHTITLHQ